MGETVKKSIITGDKAKEQLIEGAQLLYEAVSMTLGPKGQNAVIEAYGEPIVTHDGVTVAKAIDTVKDCSPGARVGIEMIKASSSKTNDNVGDGTTSSTIIAYHLMESGMKLIQAGQNAMILRRELDDAAKIVLDKLDTLAQPIVSEKATIEIATISSEDAEIGKQVGKMYHQLGQNAMVAVEIGTKPVTEYEIVEGYTFERGLISPMMMTDSRTQSSTLESPPILISTSSLALRDVEKLIQELYAAGKDGMVIIAHDFKNDLIDESLKLKGQFEIMGIKAPGFGEQRPLILNDIATLTGTKVYDNPMEASMADLGTCGKVVSTPNETVLTGGSDVSQLISDLEAEWVNTKGEHQKDKIRRRISQLRGKIGQIRVGGNTEMEAEERKFLIDDAVAATEAALKDGIVPGGATTYIELSRSFKDLAKVFPGQTLLMDALLSPFKVLMTNAGERWGKKLEELTEFGKGFDVMGDGSLIDLKEHGIIDPALVIKQAITNAVSVAGSALTTGVLIVKEEDFKDEKEE